FHHPWQHGVQTGYHGVNGCDFWFDPGQVSGSRIGTIEPRTTQIEEIEPPQWSIETLWRDDGGVGLLRENQIWKLTGHDGLLYLDLEWMVQAMLRNVHIEKSTYGGLFIRMPFRRDRPCRVVNSAGQEEDDTEQSPAAWVHLEMTVNEGDLTAGIAVLDHPDNPRHPAHWRGDSQRGINPSPCIPAAIDLAADAKMVHRYRLILHSGTLVSQEVEGHWQRYAHS
ncbi:uncharacterized protein METZ01_LOCUS409848, partial [marine metagenome]